MTEHGHPPTSGRHAPANGVDAVRAVETIYRMERVRLIAGLARHLGDLNQAEDLAQDVLVLALSRWPRLGIPQNPGAWLMMAAKRRAIDQWRRRRMMDRQQAALVHGIEIHQPDPFAAIEATLDDEIGDERLSLIFAACHPLLARDQRTALTLKILAGLSTQEIARAFLVEETTIAQRIVRAKRILRDAGIAFDVPRGAERDARLASVLEVIYLIFNEGYAASRGEDLIRPQLCEEAMRLGRILVGLAPEEPEAHGLLALMELQASRFRARTAPDGSAHTLETQNRRLWDRLLIQRGLEGLATAKRLGGEDGIYALQAQLAGVHARAPTFADTDWTMSADLYDRLLGRLPSPVVALNRAVAHAMAYGPQSGLRLLAELEASPALSRYAPFYAAKADFLMRLRKWSQAAALFRHAADLSSNAVERAFLLQRAQSCETAPPMA
ncbi:RNA polymerase sigma factor [Rhizobium sp. SSA_523]|uniref:RNA polymerase sigma factor n=1 Tax=Rhizobium sp. SSA_523 TaxID=2952477 RepID=UPI002091417F|nr:sigma-70 family RNA polymerase sigma factor [Rhizobium sp. SSA_523]MCO5733981.1 sigma-70 family RNA polymerase sigma factor [Rhizobium sp. SSA_523]WKC24626.1 sigma-70 family RNA polymerase sigma factor [Rhizobium sp. SSA_523]